MVEDFFSLVAASASRLTYAEAKAKVSILWVLEKHSISYQETSSGYSLLCPIHTEINPSCSVYGDTLQHWGCFSCGASGDVCDLVASLQSLSLPKALLWLSEHLTEASAWVGPRKGIERPKLDLVSAEADVVAASIGPVTLTTELIKERGWKFDADWLRTEFNVGEQGERIVIPYFSESGTLVTYKTRTPTTKPYSLPGSDFKDALYNLNHLTVGTPIILTGSESDTWVATWYHSSDFSVVGAPTGETARPRQAPVLAGRTVYICFDGDAAGDLGTAKWADALSREGCSVHIVKLPRGQDLAAIGDITEYLADATEAASSVPAGFSISPTGYVVDKTEISNWTFAPHYVAESSQGQVFRGVILPGEKSATLQTSDFQGRGAITRWASTNGRAWYGKDRDAQLLLGALQASKSNMVRARAVSIVGLHKNSFVWPGGTIGAGNLVFAPPFQSVDYTFQINEGRWAARQVQDMIGIMGRDITTPILAWFAVSPLRSLYPSFPLLGVFGVAGSGKTTLLEIVGPALTGSTTQLTLTATTEHAIFANIGGSNGFNIHVDELREDVRPETFERFKQMMRDLYDGKSGQKGNKGNWASTGSTSLMAPVVVSGETALTEISHKERTIFVSLNRKSAIIGGLDPVWGWPQKYDKGALAYAYLSFLSEMLQSGRFEPSRVPLRGSIAPRIQQNLGILRQGWWLLSEFCNQYGEDIGELDLHTVSARILGDTGSPLEEALAWGVSKPESGVWSVSGVVTVDIPIFTKVAKANGFSLAGNLEAIREQLMNEFDAQPTASKYIVTFMKGSK